MVVLKIEFSGQFKLRRFMIKKWRYSQVQIIWFLKEAESGIPVSELWHEKRFWTLNILDDFNLEGLVIDVDFWLLKVWAVRSLNQVITWCGKPEMTRLYKGPNCVSGTLFECAIKRHRTLSYIQQGKPRLNAYIEQCNRTVCNEWLGTRSIQEAQDHVTKWLCTYGNERPNMGIGDIAFVIKLI